MGQSNVNSYMWRELTDDEYNKYEQSMLFYKAADIILVFVMVGVIIFAVIDLSAIFSGEGSSERTKAIVEFLFMGIAAVAILYARYKIRKLGLQDLREKNLCCTTGTFVRLKEETRGRNGSTRFDYYAILEMPDGGNLKIETTLSAVQSCSMGDQLLVVRPKGVTIPQRMDILI